MLKVLVADKSEIIRYGLRAILEKDKEIKVIGFVENEIEAFDFCKSHLPDLILIGENMPICDCIAGIKQIKENFDSVKILVLSTSVDIKYMSNIIRSGADGYLLKSIEDRTLINVVKATVDGYCILHNSALKNIRSMNVISSSLVENDSSSNGFVKLNKVERRILQFIVEGKSTKEIAYDLNMAEGSVRNNITSIFKKVEVKDRIQLVIAALTQNWVSW